MEAAIVGDWQPRFNVECLIYGPVFETVEHGDMASTYLPSSPGDDLHSDEPLNPWRLGIYSSITTSLVTQGTETPLVIPHSEAL